jgi:LPS-assembly protein
MLGLQSQFCVAYMATVSRSSESELLEAGATLSSKTGLPGPRFRVRRGGNGEKTVVDARLRGLGARVRLSFQVRVAIQTMQSAPPRRIIPPLPFFLLLILFSFVAPHLAQAQQPAQLVPKLPPPGTEATLEADQQRQVGKMFYADGNVDVKYGEARLRADHVEYDSDAQVVIARGHVQLDYLTQHVDADDARYELRTGRGEFHHARGTFAIQRRPTPTLLVSPNPLYFDAEEADRLDQNTYRVRNAWLTVCNPARPIWKFYAPEVTVRMQQSVHMENGNFRLFSVPVLYFPYATLPAEKRRNSGFVIPEIGNSTVKGLVLGDAFYWSPVDWFDATLGASFYSRRGWAQNGEVRMKPWEGANLTASYFGVLDRGLPQASGPRVNQGGREEHLLFTSPVPDGWRAVADLDQLSSLTFRLAFSETFTQAVNSEVQNTAFLTKSFAGYNVDFAALSYQNYLTATPQTSVTLRTAPEARFSSVDRPLFSSVPLYFSFDAFTGAEYRRDTATPFTTPDFVGRSEFAPSVTMPLRWGPWFSVTPTFTFRSTYYGGQMLSGGFGEQGFFRNTAEVNLDVRPAALERVWNLGDTKWKHVIAPEIVYHYVNGVEDFGRFVRFDEDETLTDTNDVEYGVTQSLFRRTGNGSAQEIVSWKLAQQYYFDPTFGGAFTPRQRNVFQALDSLTPFAFDDTRHRFSPIVSDLRFATSSRYDTQLRIDFDPKRGQMTAIGTLLKIKPYKDSFLTLAHFSTTDLPGDLVPPPPNFEKRSNQVRALLGYGETNRRGWNATLGASYDVTQGSFQNQLVQVSYNTNCCGLGVEYRRFSFGTIRNESQYRFVFLIANLGSVGNLRRQERIF